MDILETGAREAVHSELRAGGLELPEGSPRAVSSRIEDIQGDTRAKAVASLYFFTTAVFGWKKLQPDPHLEMCKFLQDPWRRKVMLIPRDCYKSTVASKSAPVWILIQPEFQGLPGREHRILLASHASDNAKKSCQSIKSNVEKNTIFQWLFPEYMPNGQGAWSDNQLTFPRDGAYGEASIEIAGIDTHLVSRHYTVQIKDDIEDKASFESPAVRERVKTWYKAAEALFVEEQTAIDWLIGTRWGIDDLYADVQARESDTYKFMVRPLEWTREELEQDISTAEAKGELRVYPDMDPETHAPERGKKYYFFPKLFPEESCRRVEAKQGTWMYSMLYKNNPRDAKLAEFKEEYLQYFEFTTEGDLKLLHKDGTIEIVEFDSLTRVEHWDPAMSERASVRNSQNAIGVMFGDTKHRLFIADCFAEFMDPLKCMNRFIGFHQRYHLHKAALEDVGFQRTLKAPLNTRMMELGYRFNVELYPPVGNKDARIRGLLPYWEQRKVFIRSGLTQVTTQLLGFPQLPWKDILDTLVACIEVLAARGIHSQGATDRARRIADKSENLRLVTRNATTGY